MTATCTSSNPGNISIQSETFTIPVAACKLAMKSLDCGVGEYWNYHLVKPMRRAIRAKLDHVVVRTAGFGSGELSNVLHSVGCPVEYLG